MIKFFIEGRPRPKGSFKPVRNKKTGRILLINDNDRTKCFQDLISYHANRFFKKPTENPVSLSVNFYFKKPKTPKNDKYHITTPDIDKLLRTVLDALQGVAFINDSQVTQIIATKDYVDKTNSKEGVYIEVYIY